jgi:excinuclease ABC subunit A
MRRAGYVRVRVDGKIYDLGDEIELDKQKKHTIEVVVDRLVIRKGRTSSTEAPTTHDGDGHPSPFPSQRPALKKAAERPELYDVNAEQYVLLGSEDRAMADAETGIAHLQEEDVDPAFRQRLSDSLETTLKLGGGVVLVSIIDGEEILFSEKAACVYCKVRLLHGARLSTAANGMPLS